MTPEDPESKEPPQYTPYDPAPVDPPLPHLDRVGHFTTPDDPPEQPTYDPGRPPSVDALPRYEGPTVEPANPDDFDPDTGHLKQDPPELGHPHGEPPEPFDSNPPDPFGNFENVWANPVE